jgi:hypothetical protein
MLCFFQLAAFLQSVDTLLSSKKLRQIAKPDQLLAGVYEWHRFFFSPNVIGSLSTRNEQNRISINLYV